MPDLGDVRTGAARVAAAYLVVGIAWIVVSDLGTLGFVFDPLGLTGVQTAKGVVFVTASAVFLYFLVAREQRRLESTNEELQLTLRHASVLHRLLRHDLRNSCDVILNNVQLLRAKRTDPEEAYERIERQTDALVNIAEKSGHLRDIVVVDDAERRPIDLAGVVEHRVDRLRSEFPTASVTVDGAFGSAMAHPRIGVAIEEALRNAIVHTESDSPEVRVTGNIEADHVTIDVADDGPGIPEMELSALDEPAEEPLQHSRGVGLWLIQFLVSKANGTLHTRACESGGTVLRMTFERSDRP